MPGGEAQSEAQNMITVAIRAGMIKIGRVLPMKPRGDGSVSIGF